MSSVLDMTLSSLKLAELALGDRSLTVRKGAFLRGDPLPDNDEFHLSTPEHPLSRGEAFGDNLCFFACLLIWNLAISKLWEREIK